MNDFPANEEQNDVPEEMVQALAQTYGVELLFEKQPRFDAQAILAAMQKYCGNVEIADTESEDGLLVFFHFDHTTECEDGDIPAQFILMTPEANEDEEDEDYAASYQQSWYWQDAQKTVEKCKYSVLAIDMMANELPHQQRLRLFRNSLRAVLETTACDAVHFTLSQQFLTPADFLTSFNEDTNDELHGALNVRFYNVEDSDEMVMDTLGLAAINLPDLQCHFRDLDPNDVAQILYSLAHYLFDNGDIIEDGHTIEGVSPKDEWQCQHEVSLIDPERDVLDINPGPAFACGERD